MIGIKVARFDILKSLEDYRGMLDRMGMVSLWKWSRKSHGKTKERQCARRCWGRWTTP
jgi:hypothetical protein